MVRNIYLVIFLFLAVSCNKKYCFTKDNDSLVYINYGDTAIDMSLCKFQSFKEVKMKSFSFEDIKKSSSTQKIDNNTFRLLFAIQENSFNTFYKNKNGFEYYNGDIKEDTLKNKIEIVPFGKLSISKEIDSYIIIKYSYSTLPSKTLIMYNIKNNKLCSVVLLAQEMMTIDNSQTCRTLLLNNKVFEQIIQPSILHISIETQKYLRLKEIEDTEKFESYTFSNYRIDKEGYVRLVR